MTNLQNNFDGRCNEVPLSVCSEAIKLIFPSISIEPSAKRKLVKFIKRKFYAIDCCVLYRVNQDFNQLCKQLNLDPENREVIIREDFSVFYSPNFNVSPLNMYKRA